MVGPTIQGIEDLIAKDPNAYWDTGCNCVKGSTFRQEPARVPDSAVRPGVLRRRARRTAATPTLRSRNLLGFFVEELQRQRGLRPHHADHRRRR